MPSIGTLATVFFIFAFGGWIKGLVGIGLPVVVMSLMSWVLSPAEAATVLIVSAITTNVWQAFAGPPLWHLVRRLGSYLVCIFLGTAIGIRFLVGSNTALVIIALGMVLIFYALIGLFVPHGHINPKQEKVLSPVMGFATGVVSGATGASVVPAVPYISALNLSKEELLQAAALSPGVAAIALGLALGFSGNYLQGMIPVSFLAVVPALMGMYYGQRIRNRVDPIRFRRWFFMAMLLLGFVMTIRETSKFFG